MADIFDAVDATYQTIKTCGLPVYKDKAPDSVVTKKLPHVVINTLNFADNQFIGNVPVNINVYLPKTTEGMIDRAKFKTHKDAITAMIKGAAMPTGMYYEMVPVFTTILKDLEIGYDALNIRYTCFITT